MHMLHLRLLTLAAAAACAGAAALAGPTVAAAWYAGWHAADFPLAKVSWAKYTQLTYAFAVTTPDVGVLSLADSDKQLLPQFVAAAHKNGVKASLSIGGWTGSQWYSSNVGSAANRTAFVKAVTGLATQYKLDGIDFDWEYPNHQGVGCNVVSPDDTANFLAFLQALRRDPVGARLVLSAAVSITPWVGADGSPSRDVSAFAKVLDFVAVMNYDIWGAWSTAVGPNAPLNDACAAPANQQGSAASALAAWSAAGMPHAQLVLGVPSYGHSFRVAPGDAFAPGSTTALAAYPPFDASQQPAGDAWDDAAGPDVCGAPQGAGGTFDFWGLVAGGFLGADGAPAPGIARRFDACSQTPFVYNATSRVMVAYDDARSLAAKGALVRSAGLRGFAVWEAGGDARDILLDAIRAAAGFRR